MATSRSTRTKAPKLTRSAAWLHWIGMLAMIVSMFAPLWLTEAAAQPISASRAMNMAKQVPLSNDIAAFDRVVAIGDFQNQLGCADWDANCGQSQLSDNSGFWTGGFSVAPGSYSYDLVAFDRTGNQYSIQSGQFSVGEGQAGVYFDFNSTTRQVNAWAVNNTVSVSGPFGNVALAQDGSDYVAQSINVSSDGNVDLQVQLPEGTATVNTWLNEGSNRVRFDATGNVLSVDDLGFAELSVQRTNANGEPLSGSCFVVDGPSQSRGCDTDDGSNDGFITIRFPGGFTPGSYTLRETTPAEGQEPAPDQQIDIQEGRSTAQVQTGDQPGDLVVLRQDETGAPVGGACFEVLDANGQSVGSACDEDGDVADDGRIGIFGIPAGDYTLRETRTPEGVEPAADSTITIQPQQSVDAPVQSAAIVTEQPTEEPPIDEPTDEATEEAPIDEPTEEAPVEQPTDEATEPAQPGNLVINRNDGQGNMVGGSCFEVLDANGQVAGSQCDEDGWAADDGVTGIYDLPAGDYTLRESRTPEGYEPVADTQVTVQPGIDNNVDVSGAPSAVEQPTEEPTEAPVEEPTDAPIEQPTEAPVDEPTDEATEYGEPGNLVINRNDGQGTMVGGSCFEVLDANGQVAGNQCDEDGLAADDGVTGIYYLPSGEYTLRETRTPEGYEPIADTQVTVQPGIDNNVDVSGAPIAADQPTEAPVDQPTEAPVEEPTQEPTDDSADAGVSIPSGNGAGVQVTYPVNEGEPALCFELETTGGIGGLELPYACDNAANDVDPAQGVVRLEGQSAGEFYLVIYDGPTNLVQADPQIVTLTEGQVTEVTFEQQAPATMDLQITTTDGTNSVPGACYAVDDGTPVCDDNADGAVTITGLEAGNYTVSMTTAPEGYTAPESLSITVAEAGQNTLTFTVARATTQLVVTTTDGSNPVPGACYALNDGTPVCDDDADGSVTISDVVPGNYTVSMTTAPEGYTAPEAQPIDVAADGSSTATFTVARATTQLVITTTDGTNPVPGACFALNDGTPVCDDDADGSVTISDVVPGDYTLNMTTAPDGYTAADPQQVSVAADGSSTATFTVARETVTITVNTVDAATGAALTGACYSLDGGEAVCESEGVVTFPDVLPGDHNLVMTTAPGGYELAAEQVIPAGTVNHTVQVNAQVGSLNIVVENPDGERLSNACVRINNDLEHCDDDGDGQILIEGLAPGEYGVTLTQVADGYDLPADAQTATVVANETASITFQAQRTPPATGNMDVSTLFDDDSVANGVCITITLAGTDTQFSACDGAAEDTNPDAGVIGFQDLPTGTYEVAITPGTSVEGASEEPVVPISVTVNAGETAQGLLYIPLAPTTGTLVVAVADDGVAIGDACIQIGEATVCDNDGVDQDGRPGFVQIGDLAPGDYEVTVSTVPVDYQAPAAQSATITAGETTQVNFTLVSQPQLGSLVVSTANQDGEPLSGACYAVMQNGARIATICDANDSNPNDGAVRFDDLAAGTYDVVQTRAPGSQYATAPTQTVEVRANETTELSIVMDLRPGRMTVVTVDRDEPTFRLENACYTLVGAATFGPFCDADDGNVDGRVMFTNVPAGEYELRQTVATAGYDPAANRTVTITAGGSLQTTVQNAKTPPPAESGTLVVRPLDPSGNSVAGGCYQVFDGDTPVSPRVCDNADAVPGSITFQQLPVGTLTLRELLAPSPDWQIAASIEVTITNGETTTVEVPHVMKNGTVVIQAVNSVGLPLQGACFTLSNAGTAEPCTDSSGQATVGDLTPGTRTLTQVRAPFGYKLNEAPREVVVRPGQTTVVRVVFENQPPPNTGTVQVQKFVCPAGDGGERTVFLGGASGNAQLKQTAGCVPAVATFTLEAENGSTTSNAEFSTNKDGRAQRTAEQGIYLLTETDPNLPGNSAARIRVGVGQMTTVIVINYVAPPPPAMVTINVEGYTCPPGFTGTTFAEFQASCMAPNQLTNQITVRAESNVRYKHVTGDQGKVGKTTFAELPSGTYTVWAERPYTTPLSYLFCGPDPNAPTLRAVNGSVVTTQQGGSAITCRVFMVPPLFDAEHGAIQVQKYNCPIDERQRGYDYKNECERASEPVQFQIQLIAKDSTGEPVKVSTNSDGIAQFPMLRPGVYKLTEVGGEWCFAQSNSVDAQGNVIVNKNKLSEVWIYNCVGTSSPPNTGSGDAADQLNPDTGVTPIQMLPNLVWPVVLLGGLIVWRDRRSA